MELPGLDPHKQNIGYFIIRQFKGKRILDPLIIHLPFSAIVWSTYYLKRIKIEAPWYNKILQVASGRHIIKDIDDSLACNLLRLAGCLYRNNLEFNEKDIDHFIPDFNKVTDIKLLAGVTWGFELTYNWLKKQYPYACSIAREDLRTDSMLDWFQVVYRMEPKYFSGSSSEGTFRRLDLILGHLNGNVKKSSELKDLLFPNKN